MKTAASNFLRPIFLMRPSPSPTMMTLMPTGCVSAAALLPNISARACLKPSPRVPRSPSPTTAALMPTQRMSAAAPITEITTDEEDAA